MRSRRVKARVTLLTTVCALSFFHCVAAEEPSSIEKRLRRLRAAIEAEVGTPRADDVKQCRTVAWGDKPCGGPWKYLVYSIAVSDEKKLHELVARYNALEKKQNDEEGRASDCSVVTEPKVRLSRKNVCVDADRANEQ